MLDIANTWITTKRSLQPVKVTDYDQIKRAAAGEPLIRDHALLLAVAYNPVLISVLPIVSIPIHLW